MTDNPVIETLLNRKSIRRYRDESPSDQVLQSILRAGQQAPFAFQLCSLLLSRCRERNPSGAPLLFTICVDSHRLEFVYLREALFELPLVLLGLWVMVKVRPVRKASSHGMSDGAIGFRVEEGEV